MRTLSFLLVFFLFTSGFVGCGARGSRLNRDLKPPFAEPLDQILDLEIVREINDGELLSLVLRLNSSEKLESVPLDLEQMKIEIALFESGKAVLRKEQTLDDLFLLESLLPLGRGSLSSAVGKELLLQTRLEPGTTDYQVHLKWGANAPLSEATEEEVVRSFEVIRGDEICSDEGCAAPYEILLELQNPFAAEIGGLSVDTWFAEPGGDSQEKVRVELTGVVLEPQEVVRMKLSLTEPLPLELEEMGYRPMAEMGEFEFLGPAR